MRWFADLQALSLATRHSPLPGVIFSNELLDAMPVHRFGWDAAAKKWFEWGVALEGEKFVWAKIQKPEAGIPKSELPSAIRSDSLPSTCWLCFPTATPSKCSPAAENWWREAAGVLERGRLMTIDYGLGADELFSPSRPRGTLRAYFRHHVADDLLANAGEQDLTAHVNFPAIQAAGESAGLTTEMFLTQAQFLTRILDRLYKTNPLAIGTLHARASFKPSPIRNIWAGPSGCWCNQSRAGISCTSWRSARAMGIGSC